MSADNVLATIGNTPHMRVNRLFGAGAEVWIKSERSNPGGSIEDRIALSMVQAAEAWRHHRRADLGQHRHRADDGRHVKGYKLILVMPDSMSIERRRLMLGPMAPRSS